MKNKVVSMKVFKYDDGNDLVRTMEVIVDDTSYDVRVYWDGAYFDYGIEINGEVIHTELIDSDTYDMDDNFDEMIETFNKVSGFIDEIMEK